MMDKKTDTIVFFGLNMNNDYHVIRAIQAYFFQKKLNHLNIVFCYFSPEDRESFQKIYHSCIKYSPEMELYVRDPISLYALDSHAILQRFFVEKREALDQS